MVPFLFFGFSWKKNKIKQEKYPINDVKHFYFLYWCKVAKLMNQKSHLTIKGLDLFSSIKSEMNEQR